MLAYIQGNQACKIWVKMNADKEILNICGKYMKDDVLEIPFKVYFNILIVYLLSLLEQIKNYQCGSQ